MVGGVVMWAGLGDWWGPVLLAPFIGSFLGVVIERLPVGAPIVRARSRCSRCDHVLGPAELVPLAGFLLGRGHCRHCGAPIGWFYPAIELAALAVAVWSASLDTGPRLWADCLLGWSLLTLAWIDARHMILPDLLTLPLIPAGLAVAALLDGPAAILPHAAGAAFGWAAFAGVAWAYRRLRGRDGLGEGDARLLAAAGAWVGWAGLAAVVLLAAVLGLTGAVIGRLGGKALAATTKLPFGPPLAFATWLVWLYL